MATPKSTTWPIEPHTRAKHEILKPYLQRWFPILNKHHGRIVYIDGFSGPGRYDGGEPGSPLVALDVAATHRKALTGEVIFWFIDERPDRIRQLQTELDEKKLPSHFKLAAETGRFDEKLNGTLDDLDAKKEQMAPTFAFIDPFGFSGIPYRLIARLLGRPHCEVFITFMVDAINRWLEHPNDEIVKHFPETFGTDECLRIAAQPTGKIEALRALYQAQLQKVARFVRYFEMRNRNDRTEYLLFFATNHPLGHVKMKEAMWAVDPEGTHRFSDATNPAQLVLFESDPALVLWPFLHKRFAGRQVTTDEVLEFVENETGFLETHMKATLRSRLDEKLLPRERIQVRATKIDGKKWVKGSFPSGVIVTFPLK